MKPLTEQRRLAVFALVWSALALGCDKPGEEQAGQVKTSPPVDETSAAIERAMAFYQGRLVFERPVVRAGEIEGLPNLEASTCGQCHTEIYREWKISTHRRAWMDDAQFQAELEKSRGESDPDRGDVSWLCVNCHTPVVEQLPRLVVDLEAGEIDQPVYVDNPQFEPALQEDAITCASCHVRDGAIIGPYGVKSAPHAVRKDESLRTVEVCVRCHQAEQFYKGQNLGCFFTTGAEWRASKYADEGETCQSCHMPEVRRKIAVGDNPERLTRRHWFGGSLIPKKPEYAEELQPLEEVYPDGVSFALQPMNDERREELERQPALAKKDRAIARENSRDCEETTCMDLALVVTNDHAGHHVPTGDPERHIDVQVVVRQKDEVVSKRWTRIGSRYQWWPETKLLADTRIPSGERRVLGVQVPVRGEAEVEVIAHKYRMHQDAFDYHDLDGQYVRGVQFFERTWLARDGRLSDESE